MKLFIIINEVPRNVYFIATFKKQEETRDVIVDEVVTPTTFYQILYLYSNGSFEVEEYTTEVERDSRYTDLLATVVETVPAA